jgi:hypothetical protein
LSCSWKWWQGTFLSIVGVAICWLSHSRLADHRPRY